MFNDIGALNDEKDDKLLVYLRKPFVYFLPMNWIISWIGENDLKAAAGHAVQGMGPIGDFLTATQYDDVLLLHNRAEQGAQFADWIEQNFGLRPQVLTVTLPHPFDFDPVFEAASHALDDFALQTPEFRSGAKSYLLSPGTKAMSTALMLIANVSHRGSLYTNWQDPDTPDPLKRTARLSYFDRFGISLWAMEASAQGLGEVFRGADDREITRMASVKKVYERARQVALTSVPVLIHGESGTGKELLADYIHRSSARHRAKFVPVNCGAIPPELIDSHLFGHVKGAFTGALSDTKGLVGEADGGTLFLDEIGELPLATQARLLRFLQEGEVLTVGAHQTHKVDVRVVAATHRDLQARARDDTFRQDLYFRLAGYVLRLPPLRERLDDLELICGHLIRRWETDRKVRIRVEAGAWKALRAYPWPGNVRELQSILSRCLVDSREGSGRDRIVDREVVQTALAEQGLGQASGGVAGPDGWVGELTAMVSAADDYTQALYEIEAALIKRAIELCPSRAAAARYLNISPQRLNAKLRTLSKHGITV